MIKQANRRQFLQGAAGFTLALPVLSSLNNRDADAGEFPYAQNPNFVCMNTMHGAAYAQDMFPGENTTPNQGTAATAHDVYYGDLQRNVSGAMASFSPVLSAPSDVLTDALAQKMMVVRGLDVPFRLSHNSGGPLGNFARNDSNDGADGFNLEHRPTIDQVMAWSDSFYPDLSSILLRSMHVGRDGNRAMSWGHANPSSQSGPVEAIPSTNSSIALFNQIFVPEEDPNEPQRPLIVDRVRESYRRLRDGQFGHASRLSGDDRRRLDDHMDRIFELERKLTAVASCGDVPTPTDDAANHGNGANYQNVDDTAIKYQLYNDVIVAAFICGTSRLATMNPTIPWHQGWDQGWHQDVAHQAQYDIGAEQLIVSSHQRFFESVFMDLVTKLDAAEAPNGLSLLDNSLIMWTQECGEITHHPVSLPLVTAGSAAGYFNTGRMYDYRNRNNSSLNTADGVWQDIKPGLLWQQWLANVLMSMNVPPAEFERPGERGYGDPYRDGQRSNSDGVDSHPDYLFNMASDPLPFMVA